MKKTKKRWKEKLAAMILAAAMAAQTVFPGCVFAADNAGPVSDGIEYKETEDGKHIGIESIKLNPYVYYNLIGKNGITSEGNTMTLNTAKYREITEKVLLPMWAPIAEGFFRDQASQLVTIEGSGMMSSDTKADESFDRHFNYGRAGVSDDYADDDWSIEDFASTMGSASQSKTGDVDDDYMCADSLRDITSLGDARNAMGQGLRNGASDDDLTVDDFLGNDKRGDEKRLPDLNKTDSTVGFCKNITCINRAGLSGDYDYVCFGLAFYDFDVTPIATEDIKYIEASQDYLDAEDPIKAASEAGAPGVSYKEESSEDVASTVRNDTAIEAEYTSALTNSEEVSLSDEVTDGFQWSLEESINWSIQIGKLAAGIARSTLSFGFTTGEVWSTSKTHAESTTTRKERSITSALTLPAHTAGQISQSTSTVNASEDYQTPVAVNYKVAVYAMSGDYYNGAGGMISGDNYDKQWLSTFFTAANDGSSSGCQAQGNLYSRAVLNPGKAGYDAAYGQYKSWCDKSAWVKSDTVNWTDINTKMLEDTRASHSIKNKSGSRASIEDMACEIPMVEKASVLVNNRKGMASVVSAVIPTRDLARVKVTSGATEYTIASPGEDQDPEPLYLNQIKINGYDDDNVEFYRFNDDWGKWVLCDKDGTEREAAESDPAVLAADAAGSQSLVPKEKQDGGDMYLKWKVTPGTVIKTDTSKDGMSREALEAIDSQVITVHVTANTSVDPNGHIELSGSYSGPWDEAIDLSDHFSASVYSESGKEVAAPIYWEAQEMAEKGITVEKNGHAVFTREGEFHIRACCRANDGKTIVRSDWAGITIGAEAELTTVSLDQENYEKAQTTLTDTSNAMLFDLNSLIRGKDQYGRDWNFGTGIEDENAYLLQLASPMTVYGKDANGYAFGYTVSGGDGAQIIDGSILEVTEPGEYEITVQGTGDMMISQTEKLTIKVTSEKTDPESPDEPVDPPAPDPEDDTSNVRTVTVNTARVTAAAIDKAVSKAKTSKTRVTKLIFGKKVRKIAKKALAKYKAVKTLEVRTRKLSRKRVKGSLKGSAVRKVKVNVGSKAANKKFVKKYRKIFTKKIAGRKAVVK